MTLTIILWLGLHQRELYYINRTTDAAMDRMMSEVGRDLDQQKGELKNIAREERDYREVNLDLWETDARLQMGADK